MDSKQAQPWKILKTSDPGLPSHSHTIPAVSETVKFVQGEKIVIGGVVRTEGKRSNTKILYDTEWKAEEAEKK